LSVKKHVKSDPRLFRPQEVPHLLGDPTKALQKMGWKPRHNFDDLVTMMYEADFKRAVKEMK